MLVRQTVEIPLPESLELTGGDLELLKATFQALVALRCEKGREWEGPLRQLKEDGWNVSWNLAWRVQARRGEDYEEATAPTLREALEGVTQLVLLDTAGRAP